MLNTDSDETKNTSNRFLGSGRHGAEQRDVRVYDFRRPQKFTKEQMQTLGIMHETFGRLCSVTLESQLHVPVQFELSSVDQITFREFNSSLPNPSMQAIVNMDPLKGAAVLEFDPPLIFEIIHRLFGGSGKRIIENRDLSEFELSVIEGVLIHVLGNLREVWRNVIGLRPRLGAIETNPLFAQLLPPTEMVALVTMSVQIGNAAGTCNLCLPYLTIERIVSKLSQLHMDAPVRRSNSPHGTPNGFGANLPVEFELCIDSPRLSLAELAELKRGSMIPLETWDAGAAYIQAGGIKTSCSLANRDRNNGYTFTVENTAISDWECGVAESQSTDAPIDSNDGIGELIAEPITAMGDELRDGFSRIIKRIDALSNRQDELADHVLLAGMAETSTELSVDEPEEQWADRLFGFLTPSDADALDLLIKTEHPQLIAMLLFYIDSPIASQVLQRLEQNLQVDVCERINDIDPVSPEVLSAIERVLEQKIPKMTEVDVPPEKGHKKLSDLLDLVSKGTEKHIRESLDIRTQEKRNLSGSGSE